MPPDQGGPEGPGHVIVHNEQQSRSAHRFCAAPGRAGMTPDLSHADPCSSATQVHDLCCLSFGAWQAAAAKLTSLCRPCRSPATHLFWLLCGRRSGTRPHGSRDSPHGVLHARGYCGRVKLCLPLRPIPTWIASLAYRCQVAGRQRDSILVDNDVVPSKPSPQEDCPQDERVKVSSGL